MYKTLDIFGENEEKKHAEPLGKWPKIYPNNFVITKSLKIYLAISNTDWWCMLKILYKSKLRFIFIYAKND